MKRIAVTGAGGSMGSVVAEGLKATGDYEVVKCVHHPVEPDDKYLELSDQESCLECFKGVDTIIHLGFFLHPQRELFIPQGLNTNVVGMFNLYEAARICGVKRIVFGSSNHVFGFYPVDEDVDDYAAYRPDSIYGLCKCWGELLGRYYSDRFGISNINIRIGHCRGNREVDHSGTREYKQWLANEDLVQLMICCIEADPSYLFKCYPGISDNEDMWCLDNARKELHYNPVVDGRDLITPETVNNEISLKGGAFTQL